MTEFNTDPVMLYKTGTMKTVDSGAVDYKVFPADQVEEACEGDWFLSQEEALDTPKELTQGEKMKITKAKNKAAKEAAEQDETK